MGLRLLAPIMMVVAAGVAIPVVVHLLARRKPKDMLFPAIRFLEETLASRRSRLRLKHLLLLAMRAGVIILFALALSRPLFNAPFLPRVEKEVVRAVIILDDSFSMQARAAEGVFSKDPPTRFDRARQKALEVLKTFAPGSSVLLMRTSQLQSGASEEALITAGAARRAPSFDLEDLARKVRRAEPSFRRGNSLVAIRAGLEHLKRLPGGKKELYFISDFSAEGFLEASLALRRGELGQAGVDLVLLDVGSEEAENLFVEDLEAPPEALKGEEREIKAVIASAGFEGRRNVELYLDGSKREERFVEFHPGDAEEVVFPVVFRKEGYHQGEVRVSFRDDLPEDNRWFFTTVVGRPVSALIVREPSAGGRPPEFYLTRALSPSVEPGPILVRSRTAGELSREDLLGADALIFLGVMDLPSAKWRWLSDAVREGLGVAFFPGGPLPSPAEVRPFFANAPKGLIPVDVRSISSTEKLLGLTIRARRHPFLSRLTEGIRGHYLPVDARAFLQVIPISNKVSILGILDNGAPGILESRYGKGKVIFITVSADHLWGEFPKHPSFVPFSHELVRYLSLRSTKGRAFAPGDYIALSSLAGCESAVSTGGPSSGEILSLEPRAFRSGHVLVERPGNFVVRTSIPRKAPGVALEKRFSVNLDPEESRLIRIPEENLRALLPEGPLAPDKRGALRRALAGKRPGVEISHWLVVALLSLATLEGLFASRFYAKTE